MCLNLKSFKHGQSYFFKKFKTFFYIWSQTRLFFSIFFKNNCEGTKLSQIASLRKKNISFHFVAAKKQFLIAFNPHNLKKKT